MRGKGEKELPIAYEAIPEDRFARVLGVHMLEGHLAHMNAEHSGENHH